MLRPGSLAQIEAAGVAVFLASVLLVHAVQPEWSPIDVAVSYYMNGRWGWALGAGLMCLGGSSLLLAVRAGRLLPRAGVGPWVLAVWGVGCIAGGIFPPDPYGRWTEPPSLSGILHAVAATVAFLAFPVAAWLLSRRIVVTVEASTCRRVLVPLALSCAVALAVFVVCLVPVFSNRPPYALGLVERVLLALMAGWLVVASRCVARDLP